MDFHLLFCIVHQLLISIGGQPRWAWAFSECYLYNYVLFDLLWQNKISSSSWCWCSDQRHRTLSRLISCKSIFEVYCIQPMWLSSYLIVTDGRTDGLLAAELQRYCAVKQLLTTHGDYSVSVCTVISVMPVSANGLGISPGVRKFLIIMLMIGEPWQVLLSDVRKNPLRQRHW